MTPALPAREPDPRADPGIVVRAYREDDEAAVVDLLRAALVTAPGGEPTAAFFRWKHLASPFGPSFMLVAEAGGRLVGLRAFMRWRFDAGDRQVRALRAVDTATHPDHQGRGVFSLLTRAALRAMGGEADLVFNTPNGKSLPGYLKMGWKIAGRVPVSVRVRRPVHFAAGLRGLAGSGEARGPRPPVEADPAAAALGDGSVLRALLVAQGPDGRLATRRDLAYLRWRYAAAPFLDYRAVADGSGLAIFRVRPRGRLWEAAVAELLVPPGDGATAMRLLRRVARSAPVDHLTCTFPRGSTAARAAAAFGFLRAPGGPTFVVKPLRDGLDPDPLNLASWGLSLGDVEVF